MRNLISSLMATGAMVAVSAVALGLPAGGPGVARDEITGSVKKGRPGSFLIENDGSSCSVRRGAQIAPMVYRLETLGGCDEVLEGLDSALFWTDTRDGGIVISGRGGTVVELEETDVAVYGNVLPRNQMIEMRKSPN